MSSHSRHMCQLSWLDHKEKHRNMNHSGRRVYEAENETALTFLPLNYADGTSARRPLCEYFPWQSGGNMLIMMDVDQGPTGADDIQISNRIQRSPHPHCCKINIRLWRCDKNLCELYMASMCPLMTHLWALMLISNWESIWLWKS